MKIAIEVKTEQEFNALMNWLEHESNTRLRSI